MQLRGALSNGPSGGNGYYCGHRELSGPARQVTLPCTWHFRLSSSILSQKRLEFVVCVSQLGGPSAEQSPKTATPHGTPCGSSSLCLPLAFSFGKLSGPSGFPPSLQARVAPRTHQRGLGSSSRAARLPTLRTMRGGCSPQMSPRCLSKHFSSLMSQDLSGSCKSQAGLVIPTSEREMGIDREESLLSKAVHGSTGVNKEHEFTGESDVSFVLGK